jgi:hypothetical protein
MKDKIEIIHKYPKISLLISVCIVLPVGICYGFFPEYILQTATQNTTQNSFNKAVMGIYLVFGLHWLWATVGNQNLKTALITNLLFMFGLFFGRIVSLFADGLPSNLFIAGTIGEFFLAFYSLSNYKIKIRFLNFFKRISFCPNSFWF